ncbi:MAG: ABC-type transporter, integral rane subunit [Frankiales bacterium]|nr:ABC-type transporter, integral rane subunit [Frankiales bacterium]
MLSEMFSFPFMVNAYRAGTIVAVLAGAVGYLMVLRQQSFVGHTLSAVGFPGAAGALLLGLTAPLGYYAFCLVAALVISRVHHAERSAQAAVVGTVQAFALASGYLFVVLYKGVLSGTTALLFGSFLGITSTQVVVMAGVATVLLTALVILGRPLLFASLDPDAARAAGVPVALLDLLFLLLLGATAAGVVQITGSLMVFTLLVLPAAAARELSCRPGRALATSILIALLVTWTALAVAYSSPYPLGFWLSTLAFGTFLAAKAVSRVRA